MALNPLRDTLQRAGLNAFQAAPLMKAEADAAVGTFRAVRRDLESQVRRGDLTPKVARQRAAEAAAHLADDLRRQGRDYPSAARGYLDRLAAVQRDRDRSRAAMGTDALQRETNKLLRQLLVEQQIGQRAGEFEAAAYESAAPGGPRKPSLNRLIGFHAWADQAGDEAAREWARRQLEALRPLIFEEEDHRRIDLACDRPDRVNPRLVASYVDVLRDAPPETLETFVTQAVAAGDANACIAAFTRAREVPDEADARWVRLLMDGLKDFPDAALSSLRTLEADAQQAEQEAAQAQMENAIAQVTAEARMADLDAPNPADLARRSFLADAPPAAIDEPIGLSPRRRGLALSEYAALPAEGPADVEPTAD